MSASLASTTAQLLRDAGISFVPGEREALRIPARESPVGDIVVAFEDDEVSVFLGDITHRHFTPYEADGPFPGCTAEQAAIDAVQFIHEVIDDKWVIWRWTDGRGGCFMPDGDDEQVANAPLPGEEVECFLWSGPFLPTGKALERMRGR